MRNLAIVVLSLLGFLGMTVSASAGCYRSYSYSYPRYSYSYSHSYPSYSYSYPAYYPPTVIKEIEEVPVFTAPACVAPQVAVLPLAIAGVSGVQGVQLVNGGVQSGVQLLTGGVQSGVQLLNGNGHSNGQVQNGLSGPPVVQGAAAGLTAEDVAILKQLIQALKQQNQQQQQNMQPQNTQPQGGQPAPPKDRATVAIVRQRYGGGRR